ncbi:aspartate/glutamate racemase family protein [Lentibacillus sp. N15]|uniref:aspartate/glutamate racemase family protein n=1 Tax=Lentibacillus songyuanensis TaxID=3136161 RepID=UPI0031BA4283
MDINLMNSGDKMVKKIGLIHATLNSVQPINEAFRKYAPYVDLLNFLDDGLIQEVNAQGEITPKTLRRFIGLVGRADDSAVDGILTVCSVFTPYVPGIAHLFQAPVLSADYSMLNEAVNTGKRIGLIATVATAGTTSEEIMLKIAEEKGKSIEVHTEVAPEAFQALQAGDTAKHDGIIHQKITDLSQKSDVIVLAQISMARATQNMNNVSIPVLTSLEVSMKSIIHAIES